MLDFKCSFTFIVILHFYYLQKHPGSLLEGFTQTQVSTLAVRDKLLIAGGFQGELICKVISTIFLFRLLQGYLYLTLAAEITMTWSNKVCWWLISPALSHIYQLIEITFACASFASSFPLLRWGWFSTHHVPWHSTKDNSPSPHLPLPLPSSYKVTVTRILRSICINDTIDDMHACLNHIEV